MVFPFIKISLHRPTWEGDPKGNEGSGEVPERLCRPILLLVPPWEGAGRMPPVGTAKGGPGCGIRVAHTLLVGDVAKTGTQVSSAFLRI